MITTERVEKGTQALPYVWHTVEGLSIGRRALWTRETP